ncbi:hypothetical protein [Nocardioides sp. 503]|uniref:hypothetical protein n=1 Tax=Nocardioides sp. 503 TaxID=2508326 RepID=UPI00107051BF|nr:hypothetical protein [Nocardioides sp. 503]
MSNRRSMLTAVALIVGLAVAVGCVLALGVGQDPRADAEGVAHPNARPGAASESSQGRPGTSPSGATESRPMPSASSGEAPSATASPRSAPTFRGGVRIAPERPGPESAYRLPGLRAAAPVSLPSRDDLPAEAVFARGRLVDGYPARLLPGAPGGSVVTSSLAPSADRVHVALVGLRGRPPQRVLRFYRASMSRAGFREVSVRAASGSSAAAFARGRSRVLVTVDLSGTRAYSLFASLLIGRA